MRGMIGRRLLFMSIAWAIFWLCSCHHDVRKPLSPLLDRTTLIVDNNGTIKAPLKALMSELRLSPVVSLKEAVATTQKHWIRPQKLEREQLSEYHQPLKPLLLKQLDSLGLIEEVLPTRREYDYALVLGATYQTFKSRLLFLERMAQQGIVFKHIALLGSVRPLEPNSELKLMAKELSFKSMPATEIEMMDLLFGFSSLKDRPTVNIASPMKLGKDGHLVRANTKDTVIDFLKLKLRPGTVLVISNQPYILRQGLVVSSVLTTSSWQIESVGPKADVNLATSVFLDELARTMYEIEAVR